MGPGVKLDLWKLGEEVLAGLLQVDSFPAGLNVERIAEAHTGAPLDEPACGQALAQESLELGGVALAHRFGPADLLAQLGRELIRRRRGVDSSTIVRRGSSIVARRSQAIPLHHQRAQIARLERERAFDGGERGRVILEPGAGIREAEVGGGIGLAGRDDALEGLTRRARIASAQSLDSCLGV